MPKLPSMKRADRYVSGPDDAVLILPDGTLHSTIPVLRMIDKGMDVPDDWLKALKKTQDRGNDKK